MKRTMVLSIIAILVVGMIAGFKLFIEEDGNLGSMTVGKKLLEMERESDDRVGTLIDEIKTGELSEADCRIELKGVLKSIVDNMDQLGKEDGNYINIAYNCNVIRKLSGLMTDKKDFPEAELKVRKDKLSYFSNEVFNYCIELSGKREEEADYIKLLRRADEIESNIDQEIERYTRSVYRWYTGE